MPFIESYPEFVARQNCSRIVKNDGVTIFENGAEATDEFWRDPPADKWKRLRARKDFWELRLKSEEDARAQFRYACMNQAKLARKFALPSPPADAVDQLKAGAKKIDTIKERIRELDEELEKSPRAIARRNHAEREELRLEAARLVEDEIAKA